LAKKLE
jgi:hypothetical protein